MKSEPSCFSIDDLRDAPEQITHWDGVRNYQARNFMREMQVGDNVLFYHSNSNPPGVIGIMEVVAEAYPDHTAFDPDSEHPDPKSTPENPKWFMVDVQFKEKFPGLIPLNALKQYPQLEKMPLLRKGNRLSIMPVTEDEWDFILENLR
tara:strand:- start:714 stop:1157 length:444 start_codon:yes stop_codon:yes gene_type:complete